MKYESVHYENTPRRSLCGVQLTDKHQSTDNEGDMEAREGTRCKRCWRVLQVRARMDAERTTLFAGTVAR